MSHQSSANSAQKDDESLNADDFYVFLYDEEDKDNQAVLKNGNRGYKKQN